MFFLRWQQAIDRMQIRMPAGFLCLVFWMIFLYLHFSPCVGVSFQSPIGTLGLDCTKPSVVCIINGTTKGNFAVQYYNLGYYYNVQPHQYFANYCFKFLGVELAFGTSSASSPNVGVGVALSYYYFIITLLCVTFITLPPPRVFLFLRCLFGNNHPVETNTQDSHEKVK